MRSQSHARHLPTPQYNVEAALAQTVMGTVYVMKLQVIAPPSAQYGGARPVAPPQSENLLVRVWAKLDGTYALEGMVKGPGAEQLHYVEKNTFEGMVLRGRPG